MSGTRMTILSFLLLALSPFVIFGSDNPLISCLLCKSKTLWNIFMILGRGIGRVVRRCHVSCVTGASNWYWLTVGQGIPVAGKGTRRMFLFLLFLYFHSFSSFFPVPRFHLFYYLFPFSGRRHKMTHKDWSVVKPNTINQYLVEM